MFVSNKLIWQDLIDESRLSGLRAYGRYASPIFYYTHYYNGEVNAMCMPNPIHDLIIGNIPGVKPAPVPE